MKYVITTNGTKLEFTSYMQAVDKLKGLKKSPNTKMVAIKGKLK